MSGPPRKNPAPQGTTNAELADVLLHWLAHWLDGPYQDMVKVLTRMSHGGQITQDMFEGVTDALGQFANHALTDLVGRLHGLGLDYGSEVGMTPLQIDAKRKLRNVSNPRVNAMMFNLILELVSDLRTFGPRQDFRPEQTCVITVRLIQALSRK